MFNRFKITAIALCAILLAAQSAFAENLMNPSSFDHKKRGQKVAKLGPSIELRMSLKSLHDNQLVGTPYGQVSGGKVIVTEQGTVKDAERYNTSKDAVGSNTRLREMLNYKLSNLPFVELIERDNINSIVRELEFAEKNKYVKKEMLNEVALEMPQFFIKAFFTVGEGPCNGDDSDEEEAWGDENEPQMSKASYRLTLRFYDVKTSKIVYISCGTGATIKDAIKHSVKDFKYHKYLFYPEMRVKNISGETGSVDHGDKVGMTQGVKFILVRHSGTLKSLKMNESADVVALCEVVSSDSNKCKFRVLETYDDYKPSQSDLVVFSHPVVREWY